MLREETIEMNGFEFSISLEPDEGYHDFSWLGEYSNIPGTDAINRKRNGDYKSGEYRYFNPENTIASNRAYLCKVGYTKHQAHEIAKSYTLRDYRLMESFNNGNDCYNAMVVEVSYKGHILGTASVGEACTSWDDYESAKSDFLTELMIECMESAIQYLTDLDTKPNTLAKAQQVLTELTNKLHTEGKKNRRDSFLWRIRRWRDLSEEYQDNKHMTRHAQKHIESKRIGYYSINGYQSHCRDLSHTCTTCEGDGEVICPDCLYTHPTACNNCDSTGMVRCWKCHGLGWSH